MVMTSISIVFFFWADRNEMISCFHLICCSWKNESSKSVLTNPNWRRMHCRFSSSCETKQNKEAKQSKWFAKQNNNLFWQGKKKESHALTIQVCRSVSIRARFVHCRIKHEIIRSTLFSVCVSTRAIIMTMIMIAQLHINSVREWPQTHIELDTT